MQMALSVCTPETLSECTPEPQTMVSQCTLGPTQAVADHVSQPPQSPEEMYMRAAVEKATVEAKERFNWPRLKLFQQRAVEAWAANRHCFVISGTGSGKTACFILPALVARRWHEELDPHNAMSPSPVALVVSPLVSLMRDQVDRLLKVNVAAAVDSPQCDNESKRVWDRALRGELVVLYTSPERLYNLACSGEVSKLPKVSLLAIDEAHCVSEWGVSFREEYGKLKKVIQDIAKAGYGGRPPPVLCLTATCTRQVRSDVLHSLGLEERTTFCSTGTMNRPNLRFSVEDCGSRHFMDKRLLDLFGAKNGDVLERRERKLQATKPTAYSPTVVYANTKDEVKRLAYILDKQGVRVHPYHAGLPVDEKTFAEKAFRNGEIQAVVATIAFGMGIDKPDVRRVIHFGFPASLENYMQESGRAGRDGRLGECIVLYSEDNRAPRESAILGNEPNPRSPEIKRSLGRLQSVIHYCHNRGACRRAQLLEYLDEDPLGRDELVASQVPQPGTIGVCHEKQNGVIYCGRCDVCDRKSNASESAAGGVARVEPGVHDASSALQIVLDVIKKQPASRDCGMSRAALLAQDKLQSLRALTKEAWQRVLDAAVHHGYLAVTPVMSRPLVAYTLGAKSEVAEAQIAEGQGFKVDFGNTLNDDLVGLPKWVAHADIAKAQDRSSAATPVVENPSLEAGPPRGSMQRQPSSSNKDEREKAEKPVGAAKGSKRKSAAPPLAVSDAEEFATPPLPCKDKNKRPRGGDRASSNDEMACSLASVASPARQRPTGASSSSSGTVPPQAASAAASSGDALLPCPGKGVQPSRPAPKADPPAKNSKGEQAKPTKPELAKRTKQRTRYTEDDRKAAPAYMAKLMEAADFNSNVSGGAKRFRDMMAEAKNLAPKEHRQEIEAIPFKPNTSGVHACALDELIQKIKGQKSTSSAARPVLMLD